MAASSDPRLRLVRTSGFRLAVQGAVVSVCGALIVFLVVYHATHVTVRNALDATVANEQSQVLARAGVKALPVEAIRAAMIRSITVAQDRSKGGFFGLAAPDGSMLAGNLAIPPQLARSWTGRRTLRRDDGVPLPPDVTAIRGAATPLANGDTLYVAENASSYEALNQFIGTVFLITFGPLLVVGVIGGLLVARATLNRVLLIATISREIVNGDLSRRVPMRGSNDEFDQLAVVLNVMLDRIQALVENIRQVSNDIAHDLRSPLARLRERLELARQDLARDPERVIPPKLLDDSIQQVDFALKLFSAMLRISEVEAGARRQPFAPIDLSGLLLDLVETYEAVAEPQGKKLIARVEPGLGIEGDRELILQMFVNIIENALRHCPARTVVIVQAKVAKGRIEVVIADTGPGIPPSDRERVFQRFVRLDSSRHSSGSGLGLALVAAIAGLHGYAIRLEDNQPGLRFVLDLGTDGAFRAP